MLAVLTTGQAAKAAYVSQKTIIRCFDSGELEGFRVPGSRYRRIPLETFYRFIQENSIPTDRLQEFVENEGISWKEFTSGRPRQYGFSSNIATHYQGDEHEMVNGSLAGVVAEPVGADEMADLGTRSA